MINNLKKRAKDGDLNPIYLTYAFVILFILSLSFAVGLNALYSSPDLAEVLSDPEVDAVFAQTVKFANDLVLFQINYVSWFFLISLLLSWNFYSSKRDRDEN
jgi:hypothetical protein